MKRGTIHIPPGPLDADVARIATAKAQAWQLLGLLEEQAGAGTNERGAWRRNPTAWLERSKRTTE